MTHANSLTKAQITGQQDRFTFIKRLEDGATVYSASHEIWNTVDITFPPGYWGDDKAHPEWVDTDFNISWPEYRKIPLDAVCKELQTRLPNLLVEWMYPGFLAVHVPGLGILACGGDEDGWRIEHQAPDGDNLGIDTMDTELHTYEQSVNRIVSKLVFLFTKSPWSDVIFSWDRRPTAP